MKDTQINDNPGRDEADRLFMAELGKHGSKEGDDGQIGEESEPEGVLGCLYRLVVAFDDEDGQSEEVYHATADLLGHFYGERAVAAFCNRMDGCDDRHYFRDGSLKLVLRDLWMWKTTAP